MSPEEYRTCSYSYRILIAISRLAIDDQSYHEALTVCFYVNSGESLLKKLIRSEDTPSKEEFVSQFKTPVVYSLFMNM